MPPPHFSSTAAANAGSGGAGGGQQAGHPPSLNDLPKPQRQLVRDALQHIRASLVTGDNAPSPTNRTTTAAYDAIRKLISDPILQPSEETSAAHTSASGRATNKATGSSDGPEIDATTALNEADVIGKHVNNIISAALSRIFSDEMDQDSRPLTQLLISFLHALHPILDPICVVLEWWDVLIRPVLKNPHCNPSIVRKAHVLVIWAMRSTPSTAYVDEQAPSAIWPPPPQSATAAEMSRTSRRPGDAPYPVTSTRAASQSRSSEDGDARRTALFSTTLLHAGSMDPFRRFTQRIFDMYTSEASSTGVQEIEDDDIKEVAVDDPSPDEKDHDPLDKDVMTRETSDGPGRTESKSLELEVGPTWKGNLEAIILTFGEERPKAFFHHLSESFLEPSARIPILLLLTIFFRISSLHAYHIVSTPFVRLLILSLQLDTSKTSAALGSFALATLIPHIPNWIANGGAGGLPALLSILARIIDWRKLGPQWEERTSALLGPDGQEAEEWAQVQRISRRLQVRPEIDWKRLDTHFDTVSPPPPDAEKLFTFLYGIFPCNVIRFLRAPVDYLRKAEYESPFQADWDDILDETAVQNKAAPILRRHVVHPSLVDMDAESEISDKQRWRDHDAADITAECVCLHIGGHSDEPGAWLEGRRVSLVDHLPSMLNFRAMSASTTSAMGMRDSHVQGALSAASARAGNVDDGQTPPRFYRKRSVSENLGNPASVGSPLFEPSSATRRRDLSVQPGQQAGRTLLSSPRMLPFSQQSTLLGSDADIFLQNHVRLRYGLPVGGAKAERIGSDSQQGLLSRSSSARSHLRTFNAARANLTSSLMSPTLSQQQLHQGAQARDDLVTSPVEPASATELDSPASAAEARKTRGRSFGDSPGPHSLAVSPNSGRMASESRTLDLLDSPALGMDNVPQTRTRLKEEVKQTIAYLKQENLQLRNELNYEIGQKDQMLRHIGRIHRDRIKDTVLEDERQNLYQTVRTLRAQLKSVRAAQERSKAEALTSKNRHASWENELNAKLKAFREEKKVWVNEVRQLQIVKEDHEALIAKLEGQLHDNANEVFELRELCKRDAKKVEAIHEYEDKLHRLEDCLRMWDDDMRRFEKQRREMDIMASQYEELAMLLEATEEDQRRAEQRAAAATSQSEKLERQLYAAREAVERQKKPGLSMFDSIEQTDMARRGSQSRAQDNEEKARLRVRIEELEAALLDAKARQEEWQMGELMRRLQHERQSDAQRASAQPTNATSLFEITPDHEIAPLDLTGADPSNTGG